MKSILTINWYHPDIIITSDNTVSGTGDNAGYGYHRRKRQLPISPKDSTSLVRT
ncbi:MAG: hypothetical protein M0Q38_13095 [Bacteroidales bacterium]|nr:hypothetical protein [Bacteroidales bacterium]